MHRIPAFLLILFLAAITAGCTGTQPDTAPNTALPAGTAAVPEMAGSLPPYHTLVVEPDNGRAAVLSTIAGARHNITLTIYELNDPDIVAALAAAQERGVSVRVIYNNQSFASMHEENPNLGAIAILSAAGAGTKPASPAFCVTHQKTLTADGSRSVIMTLNRDTSIRPGTLPSSQRTLPKCTRSVRCSMPTGITGLSCPGSPRLPGAQSIPGKKSLP